MIDDIIKRINKERLLGIENDAIIDDKGRKLFYKLPETGLEITYIYRLSTTDPCIDVSDIYSENNNVGITIDGFRKVTGVRTDMNMRYPETVEIEQPCVLDVHLMRGESVEFRAKEGVLFIVKGTIRGYITGEDRVTAFFMNTPKNVMVCVNDKGKYIAEIGEISRNRVIISRKFYETLDSLGYNPYKLGIEYIWRN